MIGCKHKEDRISTIVVDNNAKYFYTMQIQFLKYEDSVNIYAVRCRHIMIFNTDSADLYLKKVNSFNDSSQKYYDLMYPNREEHLNRIYDTLYAHRKHRVQK